MARRMRADERPIPANPYRDSALVYGTLAVVLVVLALLTGGDVLRATLVAAAFFVVATAWSWWRFRTRIKKRQAASAAAAGSGGSGRANGRGGAAR